MESVEDRVTQNFAEAIAGAAVSTGGSLERFDGVTCTRAPIPSSEFNCAFVSDKAALEPSTISKVQNFYEGLKSEWRFVLPPRLSNISWEIPRRVRVARWAKEPEMVMEGGSPAFPPNPAGLEIRRIRTLDDLAVWNRTSSLGFETGVADFFDLFNRPDFLSTKGLSLFLGESSRKPVATSLLYVSDGVAGIYAVTTLPRFRGRGYGGALTAHAVREGFSAGCDLASLQASPVGVPVYFRLGFRFIFDYECWIISPHRTRVIQK